MFQLIEKRKSAWLRSVNWAWILLVILLPFTSMPWVVKLLHSDSIGAPSGIVLLLLVIGWLIPLIFRRGNFPRQSLPLMGFMLVGFLATALAAFLPISSFKDVNILKNEFQAVITLIVGVCFYLVAATLPSDSKWLELTLRVINLSGLAIILWSLAQAVVWQRMMYYPHWMVVIQKSLSTGKLFDHRVCGFALEPSWLAHQLNMLYLPFWLASTIKRYSVHGFKLFRMFTFENMLLAGGVLTLWLTLSRVGLLALLLMLAYVFIRFNLWFSRWLQSCIQLRLGRNPVKKGKLSHYLLSAGVWCLMAVTYLGMFYGFAYGMTRLDKRMAMALSFNFNQENPIMRYAQILDFGPRVIYWTAGWNTFNDHPWLGVGLGNVGFYFAEKIPPFGWGLMEVRDVMYRTTYMVNTKSLWVRIVAETGIIGFAFFISWLYLQWRSARLLENSTHPVLNVVGMAGTFVILGLLVEGFSVDSFALPYFWITLGLAAGACSMHATRLSMADSAACMSKERS